MSTFTPPGYAEVPPFAADTRGPAKRLMRHYPATNRGRTVYYLSNGSVTETDPDSNTVFWSAAEGTPYVVRTYWGAPAAPYVLTSAEEAALIAAGYGVV